MLKRLILGLTFALLAASQAQAAITVATLGSHAQTTAATNVLTTVTNDCPIHSTIILLAANATAADTLTGVTDSAGNTWQSPVDATAGTGVGLATAYAINTTVDLPVGGTITASFTSNTTFINAICVQNLANTTPLDTHNPPPSTGSAATSATSVATGTLRSSAELIVGSLGGNVAMGTFTCPAGFTKPSINNSGGPSLLMCYEVVASSSSVGFAPTWTNSANYVNNVVSFSDTNSGAVATPKGTLLGVLP